MNPDTDSSVVNDFSSTFTLPLERQTMSWRASLTSTGAPSVESDQSSITGRSITPQEHTSKTDEEKQQQDIILPSSNAFDVDVILPEQPSMTRTRQAAFIFITCISQFLSLSALNQTVAPVLVLADYFHIEDYGRLSWFSASFSMTVGTFILPAGTSPDTTLQQTCWPPRSETYSTMDAPTLMPTSHVGYPTHVAFKRGSIGSVKPAYCYPTPHQH